MTGPGLSVTQWGGGTLILRTTCMRSYCIWSSINEDTYPSQKKLIPKKLRSRICCFKVRIIVPFLSRKKPEFNDGRMGVLSASGNGPRYSRQRCWMSARAPAAGRRFFGASCEGSRRRCRRRTHGLLRRKQCWASTALLSRSIDLKQKTTWVGLVRTLCETCTIPVLRPATRAVYRAENCLCVLHVW